MVARNGGSGERTGRVGSPQTVIQAIWMLTIDGVPLTKRVHARFLRLAPDSLRQDAPTRRPFAARVRVNLTVSATGAVNRG